MKVYLVLKLTQYYEKMFIGVYRKRPEAIKYLQDHYIGIERMKETKHSVNCIYHWVYPPGAPEGYRKSDEYFFIEEHDV